MSIASAQSGYFDDAATWGGGAVPGTGDDWSISVGHGVTIRDHRTQSGVAEICGTLTIGDAGQTNLGVELGSVLVNHFCGVVYVRNGCWLQMLNDSLIMNSGDLIVEGGIGLAPGASRSQFWLMNYDPSYGDQPPRTIAITNPQNVRLGGVANGLSWLGGSSPDILPADHIVLRLRFTLPLTLAPATTESIDLNAIRPGSSVADFGFAWDWSRDQWLPYVWAIVEDGLLDVDIALKWLSDNQWQWAFELPGDTAIGSRLLVTTAHGDDPSNWRVQQHRGQIANPWSTAAQVGQAQNGQTAATGLFAAMRAAKLASDGLDAIATTAPTGPASTFREMLVQLWRRFFKKAVRSGGQLATYADDGTTIVTTQTAAEDVSGETQGAAG